MQTKEKSASNKAEGGELHFLPTFSDVPEPNIPLLAGGRKVYDEWCRTLIRTGLLTLKTREYVEMLAIATDDIGYSISKGKRPTRQAMEAKRAAMMKLEKMDVHASIVTQSGGESAYAAFGFAKRARQRRHS